jgi:AcrR family transcriptional regulator
MVQLSVAVSQAKSQLLDRAVEQALSGGIVDLSLREIAAAIGSSHRMLIYHFGSREGLLVAVVREVERRERQNLMDAELSLEDALRTWERLSNPAMCAQERLFFEIYAHALRGRPGTEGFLDEVLGEWMSVLVESFRQAGVDEAAARPLARLGLAVTRGLLLDLVASGDVDGTAEAFELFTALLAQRPPQAGTQLGRASPESA